VSATYVEVVKRYLAAVEADDVEAALQLLDADVVITPSSEFVTGSTGPYRGHAGARRWFAEAAVAAPKLRYEPYEFVDFGDQVYVSGRRSLERDGRDIGEYGASVWRFEHGFIVQVQGYAKRDDALSAVRAHAGG
jgi:ketosteroid isomerase-like protein